MKRGTVDPGRGDARRAARWVHCLPLGSPGMESPFGAEPYTVFSFNAEGAYRAFLRIEA